jgi:hypothetical protein
MYDKKIGFHMQENIVEEMSTVTASTRDSAEQNVDWVHLDVGLEGSVYLS